MKKKYLLVISLLLFIGLGYALLTANLTINGTAGISSNTWDVHFENPVLKIGSVISTLPSINSEGDIITYEVNLDKPGDYYEFNVDIVNNGTIDAMIDSISFSIDGEEEIPNYLDVSAVYENGVTIDKFHKLDAGTSETIIVHTGFKRDIEEEDLLSTDEELSIEMIITYVQKDSNAVDVPLGPYVYFGGFGDIDSSIGAEIPLSNFYGDFAIVYYNYEDVLVDSDIPVFFRFKMAHNRIVESRMAFVHNENVYYLSTDYDESVAVINDAFGEGVCEVHTDSYRCYDEFLDDYFWFDFGYGGSNISVYLNNVPTICSLFLDGVDCDNPPG